MRKFLAALFLVALIAGGVFRWMHDARPRMRILVFSRTMEFRHTSIENGKQALLDMGISKGFDVDTTENAGLMREAILKNYHVVVFLNTTGDVLDAAQQIEFQRFIQAGGGYVGVHAAADTEYDWPWYGDLVGAYFSGHPNDPNVRLGRMIIADSTHSATAGLPREWERSDEWYDYMNMQDGLNVLINVDESSYKTEADGNMAAQPRPISWYHELDGGRAFYTGLGHTEESYTEPLFLDHLYGGIEYAAGNRELDYNQAHITPDQDRFSKHVYMENLNEPMELDLLDDHRIIFIERGGRITVFDTDLDTMLAQQTIPVHSEHEDGLLGIAVDPGFAGNQWIYLYYSPPDEVARQRLSRFTMKGSEVEFESEKILLEVLTQRDECCHAGGSVEFGPDGNLFLSTGDNTNPFDSDGFAPIDERQGRSAWDAQRSSANSNDLRGKILRIKPENDGTYSIPAGNLFAADGSQGRPEIYIMGCRNPYRIDIDERTGYLYWGEVGPDAGEDNDLRGPKGHDEVNQARSAGFFGWPYFVGNNKPYRHYNFETGNSGDSPYPVAGAINASPNNSGISQLPPAQPAWIWYPYGKSAEFPITGAGGRNAMAGPRFYADAYPASAIKLPNYYDGKLFVYDWMRSWILAATIESDGTLLRLEPFLPAIEFNNPTDMLIGRHDGALYLLEYGTKWFSQNQDARLSRIEFNAGNRAPVARIKADRLVGALPLTIHLSAAGSSDPDADEITYRWTFSGADRSSSSASDQVITLKQPGTFPITLQVADAAGEKSSAEVTVIAGNDPPSVAWKLEGNRSFYWSNKPLPYRVEVADTEDANIDSGRLSVSADYFPPDVMLPGSGKTMQDLSIGETLVEHYGCTACHQLDAASVGPSFENISERYAGNQEAINIKLPGRIRSGSKGNWGETAMPPFAHIPEQVARQLSNHIVAAGSHSKYGNSLPGEGTFTAERATGPELEAGGSYVLRAAYTDNGAPQSEALTGADVLVLRYPRFEAEESDLASPNISLHVVEEGSPGFTGEVMTILVPRNEEWIAWKGIDLKGVASIGCRVSYAPAFLVGGRIDVHLDSPTGRVVGGKEIKTGIGNIGWQPEPFAIEPTDGVHDLYFVFSTAAAEGMICAFDRIYFYPG